MLSGSMKRNTLLIFDDRLPGCFRSVGGSNDSGVFPTGYAPDQEWNWPGSPTVTGNTVTVLMTVMGRGDLPEGGMWNFKQLRTEVWTFRWDGNQLIRLSTRKLVHTTADPSDNQLAFNSAKVVNSYVYLTATYLRKGMFGHDVYLTRVPVKEWFSASNAPLTSMQFLTNTSGWVRGASYGSLKPIIWGSGDSSVSIDYTGNQMHLIYKMHSIFGSEIHDSHAPTPESQWVDTRLMPAPTKPETFSYSAVVHPAWTSNQASLSRKVTLNFNNAAADANFNLGAMSRYRPELRDVVLPETVRIHTGVPGGSTVAGNLTVQGSYYDGHARAYPCNESAPTASVSNFLAGGTVSNFVVIKTDPNGDICVDSPAPAHFVFDVVGSAGQAAASAPRRLLDTRAAAMPPAGTTVRVHTQAAPGSLALGNVTVTQARGSGHTSTFPCGQPVPTTSVNNYRAGQTVPNFAATQTDSHGDICIFTSGPTHLLYDYLGSSRADVTEAPARLIDTRNGARPKARAVVRVHTAMSPGSTVAGNLTVTGAADTGHTRVWNCDESMPDTSVNNYRRGETRPNFIAVTTDNKGDFCVMNTASADIFFDSSGSSSGVSAVPAHRVADTRS